MQSVIDPHNNEEKETKRVISKEMEIRIGKIHSFAYYVIIGATGLYIMVNMLQSRFLFSDMIGIEGVININIHTLSIISGSIIGGVIGKLLSYR